MNPYADCPYVAKAMEIAEQTHRGHFRRDGKTPYINHPLAVSQHLRIWGDCDAMAVALLHDTIEDGNGTVTPPTLRAAGIPENVIEAVAVMSHTADESYHRYLMGVKNNPLATRVKVVDMLCNLSDSPTDRQIVKYAKGLQFLMER